MPEPKPRIRPPARFVRLAETDRPALTLHIDGEARTALAGDTLLVALLSNGRRVRDSEFGDGPRAGFCLMGACQDCWVATTDGAALRACTTYVAEGMAIVTQPPVRLWPVTPDLQERLEQPVEAQR